MSLEYQRTSYVFTPEELDGFAQDMESLRTKLAPTMVILSTTMRRRLYIMGDHSHPFAEQVLNYVKVFPHLVPVSLDTEEFQKDWDLTIQMKKLLKDMDTLIANLQDIYYAAGADALAHARHFYGAVKNAAKHNVRDAKSVYDELKKNYKKAKINKENPPAPAPESATGIQPGSTVKEKGEQ